MKNKTYIISALLLIGLLAGISFIIGNRNNADQDTNVSEEVTTTIAPEDYDKTRQKHIERILEGVDAYINTTGKSITDLGEIPICSTRRLIIGTAGLDLTKILVDEYLNNIPEDPEVGTKEDTGYTICVNNHGSINISAPNAIESKMQVLN